MNQHEALLYCGQLTHVLATLRSVQLQIPHKYHGAMVKAGKDIKELKHIAKHETRVNITREQVQHLQRIDMLISTIRHQVASTPADGYDNFN